MTIVVNDHLRKASLLIQTKGQSNRLTYINFFRSNSIYQNPLFASKLSAKLELEGSSEVYFLNFVTLFNLI
jgi:hypothetical protein